MGNPIFTFFFVGQNAPNFFLVLSLFECLSFVTILVLDFPSLLELLRIITICVFEFQHNLIFWVISQYDLFRCASISSSDDRHWLTDWLTDSLADWKLTVPYYLSSHHWDWDCDWIDLIDWNVRNWNVTETEMSMKLKYH